MTWFVGQKDDRGLKATSASASIADPNPEPAVPRVDADDPLAPYRKRCRPPMDVYRCHRPVHGGASHLRPDGPRVLEEWDAFTYQVIGTAPSLAAAQNWVARPRPHLGPRHLIGPGSDRTRAQVRDDHARGVCPAPVDPPARGIGIEA
ncbi:DUF6087 family protein [Streptomyces actuosus]|uniref:DUF6087 family protein n=1 Tax=Streptomyces actuosus TaxID=1885 RepID=UPI001F052F66|nr:DUF6087 family protein [Streptomyces actuosus]